MIIQWDSGVINQYQGTLFPSWNWTGNIGKRLWQDKGDVSTTWLDKENQSSTWLDKESSSTTWIDKEGV